MLRHDRQWIRRRSDRVSVVSEGPTLTEQIVLDSPGSIGQTAARLSEETGLSFAALQRHIRSLRVNGYVEVEGGAGHPTTTYRRLAR
jgi:predicted ArsR family transcriptional regulator